MIAIVVIILKLHGFLVFFLSKDEPSQTIGLSQQNPKKKSLRNKKKCVNEGMNRIKYIVVTICIKNPKNQLHQKPPKLNQSELKFKP